MINKLWSILLIILSWIFVTFGYCAVPAYAVNSSIPLLTLNDLPEGFMESSEEQAKSCAPPGYQAAMFLLQEETQMVEIVCVSSGSFKNLFWNEEFPPAMENAILDSLLSNPETFLEMMGKEKVTDLQFLQLAGIGDTALGARASLGEFGKTDVAFFRRDQTLNFVLISHPGRETPITSLQSIADKLDNHVIAITKGLTETSPIGSANTNQRESLIGSSFDQGNYELIVNEAEVIDDYNSYEKPDAANHYVSVNVTITSKVNQGFSVNPLNAVLKDSEGYQYRPTFAAIKKPQFMAQEEVTYGDKVRGWITFEIPNTAQGLVFEYRPFVGKTAKVALF